MFHQVANLLNLEVDLLFFDTTSTSFELDVPDEPVTRDEHGHALPGKDGKPGGRADTHIPEDRSGSIEGWPR